jgi:poly-gamma-glutamate capsule biosynthesis protein CapA/YwtB (metallophosphatase superfamily)
VGEKPDYAGLLTFAGVPYTQDAAHLEGVDVANLANNHAFDQGPEALLDSIENLRRADIVPIGSGSRATTPNRTRVMASRVSRPPHRLRSRSSGIGTARGA